MKWVLKVVTFSRYEKAVLFDKKVVKGITIIGIPSAFYCTGMSDYIWFNQANPGGAVY